MYEFLVFFFTAFPVFVSIIVFMHNLYTTILCIFTTVIFPPLVILLVNAPIFMQITQF